MTLIQELDFVGIPSEDAARARSFYRHVLGMRPDQHAEYEQWAGSTCFVVWEPERVGMEFIAQTGTRAGRRRPCSCGHPVLEVRDARRLDRPDLLQPHVRVREVVEEACAAAEQKGDDVKLELVQ